METTVHYLHSELYTEEHCAENTAAAVPVPDMRITEEKTADTATAGTTEAEVGSEAEAETNDWHPPRSAIQDEHS